jgi:hypothetical protein
LFRYIYLPSRRMFGKMLAALICITFSSFYHDLCAFMVTGFPIPAYMVSMTLAILVLGRIQGWVQTNTTVGLVSSYTLLHAIIILFQGSWYIVYAMEYYSRRHCPKKEVTFTNIMVPRFVTCIHIDWNL